MRTVIDAVMQKVGMSHFDQDAFQQVWHWVNKYDIRLTDLKNYDGLQLEQLIINDEPPTVIVQK